MSKAPSGTRSKGVNADLLVRRDEDSNRKLIIRKPIRLAPYEPPHYEFWCPSLKLSLPINPERGRHDDEGTVDIRFTKQEAESGNGLNRLPEAHFVGEQRRRISEEKTDAIPLIWPEGFARDIHLKCQHGCASLGSARHLNKFGQ